MKSWKCPNGHVLGVVKTNGSGMRQLMLYRLAVDLTAREMNEPDVLAVLDGIGGLNSVKCSICGAVRDWHPDKAAMRQLERRITRNAIRRAVANSWIEEAE